jgi:hypothetical protein
MQTGSPFPSHLLATLDHRYTLLAFDVDMNRVAEAVGISLDAGVQPK